MKYNKILVLLVIFAVIGLVSTVGSVSAAANNSSDNTQVYQNQTGQSQYKGPQTNTTKWNNNTNGGYVTITKNGTVYALGTSGGLKAFKPDGTPLWNLSISGGAANVAPVVGTDGTIYFQVETKLYAVNPNGTVKWTYTTSNGVKYGLVINSNGLIYFAGGSNVYAVDTNLPDPSQEDPKFQFISDSNIRSGLSLSPDGRTIYFTTSTALYALNTADLTQKWRYNTTGTPASGITPLVGPDGTIYFVSNSPIQLYALNPDRTLKWQYQLGYQNYGNIAIATDGTVYVSNMLGYPGSIKALNPNDGSVKWNYSFTGQHVISSDIVIGSDGTIYVASAQSQSGIFYAFKPDGSLKWQYNLGYKISGTPLIGPDGTLYVPYAPTTSSVTGLIVFQDLIGNFNSTPGSGLDVSFTDTSSNIPTAWLWDFGDGTTSSDQNPTHTYSTPGKYTVKLTVTANGVNDTVEKEITVNLAPTLDPIGNKTTDENQSISFTVIGHDTPGDNLTYSVTGLPTGATFNTATGAFSWTPTYSQAGTYHITFTVSDGNLVTSETITIVVINVNRAPVLGSIGNKTVNESKSLNFTVGGSDLDGDALTYSATGLPAGATFNSATGAFSWIPSHAQVGTYIITFTVFDGNATDTETITINVKDNVAPTVTKVDPAKNAVVKTAKAIKITFNETIKNSNLLIDLKNSSGKAVQFTTSISGNTLTITPKSTLASGKYSLGLHTGAITDLTGNALAAYSSSFTVDGVAPVVSKIDPANNAVKVSAGKTIKVTFNEAVKAGSLFVELKNSSGKAIAFASSISGKVLTIDPKSNLAESLYTLSIHTGAVTDLAGNPVAAKSTKFSVGTSPIVSKVDPKNAATKVARSKTIKVTFNEAIKAASGSKYWVELKTSSGKSVKITKSISGKVLSIGHAKLAAHTKYKLLIHSGAVTDKAGNPVASKTYTFTTAKT